MSPGSSTSPASPEDQSRSSSVALLGVLRDALNTGDHAPEEILNAGVNAARVLTGASGSAIGLRTSGSVLCRARSGDVAPELGTALNVESGISGACFRSASIMQCDDAQTDDRVDPEVCRMLGINSIVAMPLRDANQTIGILEVFSSRAFAFSAEDISFLKELSQIAEIAYRRELELKNPKPADPPLKPWPAAPTNLSTADAILTRAAMVPPAVREQREQEQRERELREQREHDKKITPVIPQPAAQKSMRKYWVLSGGALFLLLASAVAWWTWHEPEGESSQVVAQANAASPAATATSAPAAAPLEFPSKPSPRISTPDRSAKGVVKNASKTEPADDENKGITLAPASGKSASSPSSETTSAPEPRPATGNSSVDAPPPTVIASAADSNRLAGIVSTPTAMPSLEVRVSQGVTQANLIHKVEPVYPRDALMMRLSGNVVLNTSINEEGKVTDVKVIHGHPMLAKAAVTAVREWRYGPSLLNGKPISVQKEVTIVFKLP